MKYLQMYNTQAEYDANNIGARPRVVFIKGSNTLRFRRKGEAYRTSDNELYLTTDNKVYLTKKN